TELVNLRKDLYSYVENQGGKLTYIPFFVKAVTKALKKYPYFNATLDEERGIIALKKYYNIGIATDTDEGLMVPVISDADQKSILEITFELESLAEKARTRKLDVKS